MKKQLREEYAEKRNAMSAEERNSKSLVIGKKLFHMDCYKNCNTIFIYFNMNSEVETTHIITQAWKDNKTVAIPYSVPKSREMHFFEIKNYDTLVKSKFGVLEPLYDENAILKSDENTLVIVPVMVFDKHKNRIGYGGGYYDTYLEHIHCAKKIGIAFDLQHTENIPVAPHDVKLDCIITDQHIYDTVH